MNKEELHKYNTERKRELKIINYIANVWSNYRFGKWVLEQSTYDEDMKGIDAKGYIKYSNGTRKKILVQFKSHSFFKISLLDKQLYLSKISKAMTDLDPLADQRLVIVQMYGDSIRLWNVSIKKWLDNPRDFKKKTGNTTRKRSQKETIAILAKSNFENRK